jgi:hypothetical protein
MAGATFENVEEFYSDDERRRRSPELDYGVWWRHRGIFYRLTWVDATGELIAVQLSAPRVHALTDPDSASPIGLAVIGSAAAGSVIVLGRIAHRDAVEQILDGWADICGHDDSLVWVRRQLADAGLEAPV